MALIHVISLCYLLTINQFISSSFVDPEFNNRKVKHKKLFSKKIEMSTNRQHPTLSKEHNAIQKRIGNGKKSDRRNVFDTKAYFSIEKARSRDTAQKNMLPNSIPSFPTSAQHLNENIDGEPTYSNRIIGPRKLAFFDDNQFNNETSSPNEKSTNKRICDMKPDLSPTNHLNNFKFDERIEKILGVIQTLSPMNLIHNYFSHQYEAACYILFDDIIDISVDNESLIQRYSLAVFLYATNQRAEFPLPKNICNYAENKIKCNDDGIVTKLDWGKNTFAK